MPIISVKDNENNRWKRNSHRRAKTEKNKGVTKAIMKAWELNDSAVQLT